MWHKFSSDLTILLWFWSNYNACVNPLPPLVNKVNNDCILSLKIKNSEGFDRIPQRILVDGLEYLIVKFQGLFSRIYTQRKFPLQWLVSKTIPVFKSGDKKDIATIDQFPTCARALKSLKSSSWKEFWKSTMKKIRLDWYCPTWFQEEQKYNNTLTYNSIYNCPSPRGWLPCLNGKSWPECHVWHSKAEMQENLP